MTNDERNPIIENPNTTLDASHLSAFGLRHGFVIRHSGFVILIVSQIASISASSTSPDFLSGDFSYPHPNPLPVRERRTQSAS
jgi:hypothetical protein